MIQANGERRLRLQPAQAASIASEPYQMIAAVNVAIHADPSNSEAPAKTATRAKRPLVKISGAKAKGKVARRSRAQRTCRAQTSRHLRTPKGCSNEESTR